MSFVLVAVACGFAALCYAEFASMVPVAGSAYTYAYATLGELVAWIIGWDLILEYAVGNVAVAISWSDYFQSFLRGVHVTWPCGWEWITALHSRRAQAVAEPRAAPSGSRPTWTRRCCGMRRRWPEAPRLAGVPDRFRSAGHSDCRASSPGCWSSGIRESSRFNTAMVLLKLAVVGLFIAVGAFYVRPG